MDKEQRRGIINASLHIVEAEIKITQENKTGFTPPVGNPASAIMLAINALPLEDQTNIAKRIVAYLKEQEMLLNQKS